MTTTDPDCAGSAVYPALLAALVGVAIGLLPFGRLVAHAWRHLR